MNTEEKNRKLAVFPRTNPNPVLEFSADGDDYFDRPMRNSQR